MDSELPKETIRCNVDLHLPTTYKMGCEDDVACFEEFGLTQSPHYNYPNQHAYFPGNPLNQTLKPYNQTTTDIMIQGLFNSDMMQRARHISAGAHCAWWRLTRNFS
jgi:hypothetical protein